MATKKTAKPKKSSPKDSIKSLKAKIKLLEQDLSDQNKELEGKSDKSVRLLAEFDNYKRRTQEDRLKLLKYAGEDLAKSLLPILDDLQRTISTDSKTDEKILKEGIELIISKMIKAFDDQGISAFDSIGQDFDADLHEALMSEESDKGEDVILKEFEKGYMYNDKVLRHAKVVVSKS